MIFWQNFPVYFQARIYVVTKADDGAPPSGIRLGTKFKQTIR